MHVLDGFHIRITLDRNTVKAGLLPGNLESSLQTGQAFQGRSRSHMLHRRKQYLADAVLDRYYRVVEIALVPGIGGTHLAFHRIGVKILAGEPVDGRNQVCADTLGHKVRAKRCLGIRPARPRRRRPWVCGTWIPHHHR